MSRRKKRGATRRAKAIRFRFKADGDDQRVISTNVSASGAYLKASLVPPRGTILTLQELHRGNAEHAIRVRGEVRWSHKRPTLDGPETGFGLQLVAAWSPVGDEKLLTEFLRSLSAGIEPELMTKERGGRRVTMYRFPTPDELPGEEEEEEAPAAEHAEFEGIDLETAIQGYDAQLHTRPNPSVVEEPRSSRLTPPPAATTSSPPPREDGPRRRDTIPALLLRPRSRPRTGQMDSLDPDAGPGGFRSRSTPRPDIVDAPLSADERAGGGSRDTREPRGRASRPVSSVGPLLGRAGPRTTEPPRSRRSSETGAGSAPAGPAAPPPPSDAPPARRNKGWTGIFNTIFSQPSKDVEPVAVAPPPEPVPASQMEGADVMISWQDSKAPGRVERISETMITVIADAPGPEYYERVQLVPTRRSRRGTDFVMFGTITRIREAQSNGEQVLSIRFTRVDEKGNTGVFQEYLTRFERGE